MFKKSLTSFTNLIILITLMVFSPFGCYDENSVSDSIFEDFESPTILGVDPENGASGVDRNTDINIGFSGPMDTASFADNCYLTGGDGMRQWMDSLNQMHGGGHMNNCDDSCMTKWIDSISYPGQFHWNQNLDSCEFQPDSSLMPNEDHLLFITGPIHGITGAPMNIDTFEHGGYMSLFHTGQ